MVNLKKIAIVLKKFFIQTILRRSVWFQYLADYNYMYKRKTLSAYFYLAKIKGYQKKSYQSLRNKFSKFYKELKKIDINRFTIPFWYSLQIQFEKATLPYPSFNFLKNPVIRSTMYAGGERLNQELIFLEQKVPKNQLKKVLVEDYVSNPLLVNSEYITSSNSIHLLYHFIRFSETMKYNLNSEDIIIEWGGGYGCMAKLIKRLKTSITYIIIDLPLMSCLQWLYLSTIFGEKNVDIFQKPDDQIKIGKINLIPICFLENLDLSANLFISTWALSESSIYAQDYVVKHNWFHSKHLLLGYQDSNKNIPYADRFGKIAREQHVKIEDIEFLPGNHYAFR